MKKNNAGFVHLILIIAVVFVIAAVALIGAYVFKNKSSLLSGGYKWSTMGKGPYNDKVMYLTATDPYSWQGKGTLLAEHASVPDVLYLDNTLFVYFVDVSQDGKAEQIGIKTSTDNGKTWSDKTFATFSGIGDKVPVDPAPMLLEDGRVRLYYYDIGKAGGNKSTSHTIYSAISDDGYTFTQEEGSRFTYDDIYDPDIMQYKDGWRLYVGTGDQKVLTATSKDGLTFTFEGIAFEGGAIPNVILEDDTYILYTGGIQIATSKDGKTFTKTSSTFNSGGVTADPGVIKLADGLYFMAFKTSDVQPQSQPAQPPQNRDTQPSPNQPANAPANGQELPPLDPNQPQPAPANR